MTNKQIEQYVKRHGCFCGGDGVYTDYNCGASYEVTCPHCRGTGKKSCTCSIVTLTCNGAVARLSEALAKVPR